MADPMKYELSLRLRSPRLEPGSRPIEAWNDVSYDAVMVRAYKRPFEICRYSRGFCEREVQRSNEEQEEMSTRLNV
ncbi:hypothetical protein CEXT_479881 [Caerostris extrusa]|uniref:Uncharacterized protein n=1 Tax=Caerostris extrusa TaxID=172846 RepID=A0AAV4MRX0_CAEEX|nr:hypothetical protein CEXT_479881 [Caerostris extrusa]